MCYKIHVLKFTYKCTWYKFLHAVLFYGKFLHLGTVLSAFFLCPQKVQEHVYVLDQEKKKVTCVLSIYSLNSLTLYY
jgi:hypothetical protein